MALSVRTLVQQHAATLQLSWIAGESGAERIAAQPSLDMVDQVGYLNLIHPHRIQVLGRQEIAYYEHLDPVRREHVVQEIVRGNPPALIIAENAQPPAALHSVCDRESLPMLASPMAGARMIELLRYVLARAAALSCSMHGVLMDVLGMGVLISGDSGVGKSELALELISRGHGLVADDVVELQRVSTTTIEGRCPPLLRGLLEVRGLGLLDIKTVFGETAVRRKMRLKLIVHLLRRSTMEEEYERLPLEDLTEDVLGMPMRKVVVPVAAGRNLAVLTEAAVRNTILQLRGVDTTRDFVERQQKAIDADYD